MAPLDKAIREDSMLELSVFICQLKDDFPEHSFIPRYLT
jgi:hypothetical protein